MRFLLTISLFLGLNCFAAKVEVYTGEAKKRDALVYTEKHTVNFDDQGKVTTALTEYSDPEKKLIATLKSDFTKSLTAPDYVFTDLRLDATHGIRSTGENLVLFKKDKDDAKEQSKEFDKSSDKDRVAFGCQGLNYYLRDNLDALAQKKELPIVFITPGNLGSYNFKLEYVSEKDNIVSYDVHIDNFFLRIFAPKLEVKYDKTKKRIIWYKGLSNIQDEKGHNQSVEITYKYDNLVNN